MPEEHLEKMVEGLGDESGVRLVHLRSRLAFAMQKTVLPIEQQQLMKPWERLWLKLAYIIRQTAKEQKEREEETKGSASNVSSKVRRPSLGRRGDDVNLALSSTMKFHPITKLRENRRVLRGDERLCAASRVREGGVAT